MIADERELLRDIVATLVQIARRHGADEGELVDLLGASDPANVLTDQGVMTELDRLIENVRALDPVMVSYDWVAQRFEMTTQGVSWLCKSGRLHSVKIRHEGRSRTAIPLWAVCQYFGPLRARRNEITAHLARNADGEIAPVFLENVKKERSHPMTFRLCGDDLAALRRRTIQLVEHLARQTGLESMDDRFLGSRMLHRPGGIAERVGIWIPEDKPWRLRVNLWPASTAGQADRFREDCFFDLRRRDAFLSLHDRGWAVGPNLNFASLMGRKFFWATTTCGTHAYLDHFFTSRLYGRYWYETPPQRNPNARLLLPLIGQWEHQCLLGPNDQGGIERNRGNMTVINVNPEFSVHRDWFPRDVIVLEEQGLLEAEIIRALATPLETWGETLC